jgi:hypothetical protein
MGFRIESATMPRQSPFSPRRHSLPFSDVVMRKLSAWRGGRGEGEEEEEEERRDDEYRIPNTEYRIPNTE